MSEQELISVTFNPADPYRRAQLRWQTPEGVLAETRDPGADISDLPFDASLLIATAWTEEVVAAWNEFRALSDAPGPPPPVVVSYANFRARWTDEEIQALYDAKAMDWRVDDLYSTALAQNSVNLTSEASSRAKQLFVALGVLTADRAAEIFKTD